MLGRLLKGIGSSLTKNIFYQAASKSNRDLYGIYCVYLEVLGVSKSAEPK